MCVHRPLLFVSCTDIFRSPAGGSFWEALARGLLRPQRMRGSSHSITRNAYWAAPVSLLNVYFSSVIFPSTFIYPYIVMTNKQSSYHSILSSSSVAQFRHLQSSVRSLPIANLGIKDSALLLYITGAIFTSFCFMLVGILLSGFPNPLVGFPRDPFYCAIDNETHYANLRIRVGRRHATVDFWFRIAVLALSVLIALVCSWRIVFLVVFLFS